LVYGTKAAGIANTLGSRRARPAGEICDLGYLHAQLSKSKPVVMEGSGHLPAMMRLNDVATQINAFFRV
jgi:hypothetical protein